MGCLLVLGLMVAPQGAFTASAAPTAGPVKATLAGFNAGNIISDAVFTDSSTMTEAQIQSFFNGKVSQCLGGIDEDGRPIVCLKDFRMTSSNRPADAYCAGYSGQANESAARIIYRVSQSCHINPRVLIVMLQKEQGLVTHVWPSAWRYDAALGQGCPDDAPCDPSFVGFFQQIYGAARQMQIYMEGRWFTWYAPGNTWNILYNPNRGCGSSPVYIANKATAALYYYTPYQPNAAAMRAGYGEGDSCSAYGNRNFYNYFTDWFGSTQTVSRPAPPIPKISSFDKDAYILATDATGGIFAYPYRDGTWGLRLTLASVPGATRVFAAGDLDGDGHRDLVALTSDGAFVLHGHGTGSFSEPKKLPVSWGTAVQITAAGDFNADGVPDVFTTDGAGRLWLWPGNARGTFNQGIQVGSGWQTMTSLSGGADANGDGVPDLYARDAAGVLYVYYGASDASWGGRLQIGVGFNSLSPVFQSGDVTGDGRVDVMGVDSAGVMALFRGTSSGAIVNGPRTGSGWKAMKSITGAGPRAGSARSQPAPPTSGAGDVDGDGANDVLGLNDAKGSILAYRGSGTGSWRGALTVGTGWASDDRIVTLGDFDGDRISDLGWLKADGTLWLLSGNGRGGYAAPREIGQGWDVMTALVGGIDFDGDGRVDVLARTGDGTLLLYRGNGRGGWVLGSSVVGNGWNVGTLMFNAGDIDGDGYSDVLMRREDGSMWLYPTTAGGGWWPPRQVGNGWNVMTAIVAPGDFNGDGVPDLLARDASGLLWLYPGAGSAKWGARSQVGNGWEVFSQLG